MNDEQDKNSSQETLSIVLGELKRQLESQLSRRRHIESKATVFLGLFAVMVGIVMNQWATAEPAPWGYPTLQLLGLLALLATLAAVIASLWPQDLDIPPDPVKLYDRRTKSASDINVELAGAYAYAYGKNLCVEKRKLRLLKASYVLLAVDIAIVATPFVVKAVPNPWR